MRNRQTDRDLVGVRTNDASPLAGRRRKQWENIWCDLDSLLSRA
jgi:hypothetical protein